MRKITIIGAVLAGAMSVVAPAASSAATVAARPTPLVLHSPQHFSRKPATITHLGKERLTGLRWTLYNQVEGKAHGTVHVSGGAEHKAQVRVAEVHELLGKRIFKNLRLDWTAGGQHEVKFFTVSIRTGNWREVG